MIIYQTFCESNNIHPYSVVTTSVLRYSVVNIGKVVFVAECF